MICNNDCKLKDFRERLFIQVAGIKKLSMSTFQTFCIYPYESCVRRQKKSVRMMHKLRQRGIDRVHQYLDIEHLFKNQEDTKIVISALLSRK